MIKPTIELDLLEKGYDYVVGIDEVGRGSWAGPVVAGAFVFKINTKTYTEVDDSKKLSEKKRQKLNELFISEEKVVSFATEKEVDELNIVQATQLAMERLVEKLSLTNAFYLVDGYFKKPFPFKYKCLKRGDSLSYSIAAGSIVAKVYRDNWMRRLSEKYPGYGFETNVGYGTQQHRKALKSLGACKIHRKSYKPVRKIIEKKKKR